MKYMGSKSRIAKYIVPILQSEIDKNDIKCFIDMCSGGCNIIDKIRVLKKFAVDYNKYLIALFTYLQQGGNLPDTVSFEFYSKVRADPNDFEDWLVGAVGFLASYNGRFFDGGYAKPGYEGIRYRDYYQEAKSNILNQISNLKDVKFYCASYEEIKPEDIQKSLIYCDPPYVNTKQYTNSKIFNYDLFWQWVRDMSQNNIVYVSEMNAPKDFTCVWQKEVSRSIKATDKSIATEKLFIYLKYYF